MLLTTSIKEHTIRFIIRKHKNVIITKYFIESDKPMESKDFIYIKVGDKLKNDIKLRAEEEGGNMSAWVRRILIAALKK